MTTVQLPDDPAWELMALTEQLTAEASALRALEFFVEQQRGLACLQARAAKGSREKFDVAVALVSDIEPAPEDRLP